MPLALLVVVLRLSRLQSRWEIKTAAHLTTVTAVVLHILDGLEAPAIYLNGADNLTRTVDIITSSISQTAPTALTLLGSILMLTRQRLIRQA